MCVYRKEKMEGVNNGWEKAMAPHSSVLAWRIPWTEKPGRLQSMGSQRVGHNWAYKKASKTDPKSVKLASLKLWSHQKGLRKGRKPWRMGVGKREQIPPCKSRLQIEKGWRTSLVVQWLRLPAPKAEALGSIPDQGNRSCLPQWNPVQSNK